MYVQVRVALERGGVGDLQEEGVNAVISSVSHMQLNRVQCGTVYFEIVENGEKNWLRKV